MGDASFPRGPTAWSQGPLRLQDIRGSSPFSDIELFWDLWIPWLPWPLSFSFSANSVSPLGVGLWWGWEPLQPFPSLGLCLGTPPRQGPTPPLLQSTHPGESLLVSAGGVGAPLSSNTSLQRAWALGNKSREPPTGLPEPTPCAPRVGEQESIRRRHDIPETQNTAGSAAASHSALVFQDAFWAKYTGEPWEGPALGREGVPGTPGRDALR